MQVLRRDGLGHARKASITARLREEVRPGAFQHVPALPIDGSSATHASVYR